MKRIKVAEATGKVLDWMVAKCEGHLWRDASVCPQYGPNGTNCWQSWRPSTNWAQGGPIVEREKISIRQWANVPIVHAYMPIDGAEWSSDGGLPLVAAMRCFVASKLGGEVDVPEELL